MIREYLFEAFDERGAMARDSVVASSVSDAVVQLERMGYRGVNMLSDDLQPFKRPVENRDDPDLPAMHIQSRYDALPVAIAKIYARHWIFLAPAAIAAAEYAWTPERSPAVWASLLVTGLIGITLRALPAALYNQLLSALVAGRPQQGLRYVALLRLLRPTSGMTEFQLDAEEGKFLAQAGRIDEALLKLKRHDDPYLQIPYLTALTAIYDHGGQRENKIATQRKLLDASENNPGVKIDLAWTLARSGSGIGEARALIAGVKPEDCAELYRYGLRIVQGLVAQADGQHQEAFAHFNAADLGFAPYTLPLFRAMRIELRAYAALSMKALGKRAEADILWQQALPHLHIHHGEDLIERYEGLN